MVSTGSGPAHKPEGLSPLQQVSGPSGQLDPLLGPATSLVEALATAGRIKPNERLYFSADALSVAVLAGLGKEVSAPLSGQIFESITSASQAGQPIIDLLFSVAYGARSLLLAEDRGAIKSGETSKLLREHSHDVKALLKLHLVAGGRDPYPDTSSDVCLLARSFAEMLARTGNRADIHTANELGRGLSQSPHPSEGVASLHLIAKALGSGKRADRRAEVVILDSIAPLAKLNDLFYGALETAHAAVMCLGDRKSCLHLLGHYNDSIMPRLKREPLVDRGLRELFSSFFTYIDTSSKEKKEPGELADNLDKILRQAAELSSSSGDTNEAANDVLLLVARIACTPNEIKAKLYELAMEHATLIEDPGRRNERLADTARERVVRLQDTSDVDSALASLSDPNSIMRARYRLAFAASSVGQSERALQILTENEALASAVMPQLRFLDRIAVIGIHLANGDRGEAARELDHAFGFVRSTREVAPRFDLLRDLADSIREGDRASRKAEEMRRAKEMAAVMSGADIELPNPGE